MNHTVLDTAAEADAVQRYVWRRMGPTRRLQLALQMRDDVRAIAIEGARRRSPDAGPDAAEEDVLRRVLGDALFEDVRAAKARHGRR